MNRRQLFATVGATSLVSVLSGDTRGAKVTAPDDISSLFVQPAEGSSQDIRYRQGTIVAWNPVDLTNQVAIGTTIFTNLPVLGVGEAISYDVGDVVGLLVIGSPSDGSQTYAIIGQLVIPGTQAAKDAITQLGTGVAIDLVTAQESTTSVAFTDLTTPGPTVSVNIRASGKALVFFGATINVNPPNTALLWGGFMSADVTGANVIGPLSLVGSLGLSAATAAGAVLEWSFTRMMPLSGLTPGLTTFTAKYAIGVGNPGETARFRNRSIAVFAL